MKKYLKLLSLVLCCALLATVIPTTMLAFAADEAETAPNSYKGVKYDDADWEEGGNWGKYEEYMSKDGRLKNLYVKLLSLAEGDSLNVAFLGGSITNGSTASNVDATSYRCLVGNAITELVKEVHNDKTVVERVVTPYNVTAADYTSDVEGQITVNNLNSAYGATASWNAVYRFKEDAGLDNGNEAVKAPDVAFVEFAYNDMCAGDTGANRVYTDKDGNAAIACAAEYESIILQLIEANPEVEIIGVFTTGLNYYDYIDYEKYPSLSAQRAVLRKYDIPYLYVGKDLVENIKAENPEITDNSQFKNEEGNPWRNYFEDQVHPGDAGHAFYANKIATYIRNSISAVADYSAANIVTATVRDYADIVANGTFFDTSILKLNAKSDRIAELYADYLGDTEYVTGWRHYDWKYVDNAEAINNARHQSEENASFFTIKEGSTFAFRFTGTSVGIWYNGLADNVGKMQAYVFEVAEDGSKALIDIVNSTKRTDTIPLCWRLLENAPDKTYEIRVTTSADVGTHCNIKRIFINGSDLTPVKHGLDVPKNLLGNAGFTKPIASSADGYDVEGNFVDISGTGKVYSTDGKVRNDADGIQMWGEKIGVIGWGGPGMRQKVALKNGETYKFALEAVRNGSPTKARLQVSVEYLDDGGNFVTHQSVYLDLATGDILLPCSETFTVSGLPENVTTYLFVNSIYSSDGFASVWLDNISLTKADFVVEDTTKEMIADPGFEQGAFQNVAASDNNRYNGWASVSATSGGSGSSGDGAYIYTNSPLNANVRTGDSALRLYSTKENWHTVNTYFIIEPGKTYEYSFYGRDDINTCGVEINLRLKQYTSTFLLTENHTMTTAWTKYSGTFTAPSNAQDNTLFFAIKGTGGNIYIDDVSIKEVISIPSPEIIADPDFERNTTGFVASGNETTGWYCPDLPNGGIVTGKRAYYYPNAMPANLNCRTGTGALRLYVNGTSWHAANTHVILEPGKTYEYSFWARSGNANATVTLSISKMPYTYMVFEKQDKVTLTNAWVQYKGTFTAPSGSTDNKFYFAFGNVTVGDVFIDDVSLKLVEETSYATEDLGFNNYTLKLDGKIGLGFNAKINARLAKNGYARFKVDGDVIEVPLTDATVETDGSYTVFCPLTSVQMGKEVKAQLFYADGTPANNVAATTAQNYVADLLESDKVSSEVKMLATAMKNYTNYAEDFFAGEQIADTAYDSVEADVNNNYSKQGEAEGVEFYGYDLVLNDGTDLRLYFKADSAPTVKMGDADLEVKAYVEGYYYVTIPNIAAHELNKKFTVVANDGLTVEVCALSYANSVIKANYNKNLVKLCKALYNYSDMAVAYKNAQ